MDDISVENLKYALKTGNEIGSHTYSHKILTQLKETNLPDEFNKVNNIIKNKLNYEIKLVRPPYGIINNQIKSQYNYSYIIWDIDTLDWKLRSANKIYNKVVGEVNDGDIVLMHETYYSTYKALERILPALYSSGFQVTTVSNLAKLKGIDLKPNTVYYNFK